MATHPIEKSSGTIGKPEPRYEGRAKVTGRAIYAPDETLPGLVHAYFVGSRIARGKIRSFDLREARALAGVIEIVTHENIGPDILPMKHFYQGGPVSNSVTPLASADIAYAGQTIAVVIADTYEAARDAAHRIQVDYEEISPSATFGSPGAVEHPLVTQRKGYEDPQVGNFEQAFEQAQVKIDTCYSTPAQHHNPIELFSVMCSWNGPNLTVHEPSQSNYGKKFGIARQLGIDPEHVRVVCRYTGGGFGSKGILTQRTAIIAVIARKLGRPVKLVPTREQGFTITTYRGETHHRMQLGASRDGKLQALNHEGWEIASRADPYAVSGTEATTRIYACPNIASRVSLVRADRSTPGFMRAPPEMPYFFALESAMDELAVALEMDPIELRRVNETAKEPIKGLPYTSRALMPCFDRAAKTFGWEHRDRRVGSMRDGDWLVGWGCAAAAYPALAAAAAARVRLFADGRAQVETAGHEIGQGMYTVAAQTAAERLGLAIEKVSVALGDTNLPPAPMAAGSISTASICSAIVTACDAIRLRLGANGTPAEDVIAALRSKGMGSLEELAEWAPQGAPTGAIQALYKGGSLLVGGARMPDRIQSSFGAQFVEIRIHSRTREIRVPRMVGAFAAGRIMNQRMAHSQYMGGMIWGVGSALHEQTEIEPKMARFINTNLADYMLPVNADIGEVQVIMVPEEDTLINPLGIKGIGEIGVVGVASAIANAVYHATGKRLRDLPLRIENLLDNA